MGYILKLPTAGNADLPLLGDIGYISSQNLLALYLIDGGSGLDDASGNGNTLALAAGSVTPPYSGGVLQFRGEANGEQLVTTGLPVSGPNCTLVIAAKKRIAGFAGGTQVLFGHQGAALAGSSAGPMTLIDGFPGAGRAQCWGQQGKRPEVTYTGNLVGTWAVWIATRSSSAICLSLNGQAPVTVDYDTPVSSTTSNNVALGVDSGRPIDGDVGFFAVYDRAFSELDISSTFKGIKRLMAAKGIVV